MLYVSASTYWEQASTRRKMEEVEEEEEGVEDKEEKREHLDHLAYDPADSYSLTRGV